MIIRLTFSHADPDKVMDIRALYLSKELNDFFNSQPGHRFHYLLESGEDKSDIMFLTAWDSVEEMDAAYASEAHHIVGSKFKPFLTAPSSKRIYEVHEA